MHGRRPAEFLPQGLHGDVERPAGQLREPSGLLKHPPQMRVRPVKPASPVEPENLAVFAMDAHQGVNLLRRMQGILDGQFSLALVRVQHLGRDGGAEGAVSAGIQPLAGCKFFAADQHARLGAGRDGLPPRQGGHGTSHTGRNKGSTSHHNSFQGCGAAATAPIAAGF
jgi:hypothetical protein